MCLLLFNKKLHFSEQTKSAAEAFGQYPLTEHNADKMKMYRPAIRSMEGIDFENNDYSFSKYFWIEIGTIDECKPIYIKYDKRKTDMESLLIDSRNAIDYAIGVNKEALLEEIKFSVITGSICYALKIFEEISINKLDNCILARHGIRTILEVIIIIKYLLKKENSKPEIWNEYKTYGISKYKLILLKSREKTNDPKSHFVEPIVDILVNEIMWEEFIDIDLKYFDQQGIREKCIDVGEKDTYDILYDYDSSFVHGLWGSIRESSMLPCDNVNHKYHTVPDVYNNQKLPSVMDDAEKAIIKLMQLFGGLYSLPDWYEDKYGIRTL
jgi:hypothetical protein